MARPPTACNCGGIVIDGKCNRCEGGKRKKTGERGYGWDWQRFRSWYLSEFPLCEDCTSEGYTTVADELHHKVKIVNAPERRLDPENVMGLCGKHHDIRTARGE
tara:strand:- start:754 stop:1065 length:312 start_codon:yes stop_codon:yes gene_type:complete